MQAGPGLGAAVTGSRGSGLCAGIRLRGLGDASWELRAGLLWLWQVLSPQTEAQEDRIVPSLPRERVGRGWSLRAARTPWEASVLLPRDGLCINSPSLPLLGAEAWGSGASRLEQVSRASEPPTAPPSGIGRGMTPRGSVYCTLPHARLCPSNLRRSRASAELAEAT